MDKEVKKEKIYEELRKYHGSIGKVAELSGYNRGYVSRVLNQHFKNASIWKAAARVLKREKNAEVKIEREIIKLSEEIESITI